MPPANAKSSTASHVVRFDRYEADLDSGELRKSGIRIKLREQSFQVLTALLEQPGQVVSREQLYKLLWHGNAVLDYDNNLNAVVAHLREALNDSAEQPRFIETLPKHGYRFVADAYKPEPASIAMKPARARLVVLPFANLSGDITQEYFCDAMTDEIITALASLSPQRLAVIARTTAMHYKGSHKDVGRIGRELNADYVVEGGMRRDKDHTTVNVQLIHSGDQAHLFARRYEAELHDIFRLQHSIAQDIATHVDAPGLSAEVRARVTEASHRKQPTQNLAAYNEYIQGRYLAERLTVDSMARSRQHFEHSIAADPDFALAHIALADLYSWLGYLGYMRPKDAYSVGISYALRAAEIDDSLAEAHAVLAEYHKQLNYDWSAAEREMAKALELSPASPFVRLRHAVVVLMPQNRIEEAVAEIERALESDPLAAGTRLWLGIMLLLARKYDRAIAEAARLFELEPASPWPPYITGIAYRQKYFEGFVRAPRTVEPIVAADWAEKAIAGHLRAIELAPGSDVLLGWLGLALAVCGKRVKARSLLDQFHCSERYILPTSFGHVHLGLGEYDAALEWFDRAVDERDQIMMPILSYAHFDALRTDPRFAALLHKMNLVP